MLVIHVHIRVKPEALERFRAATLANAASSLTEPGVLRFDVLEDQADPTHLVLVEVYRDPDAQAAHRQTAHYATWRDAVAEMMAQPRIPTRYNPVFPDTEARWQTAR
jgi:autoinducer 2-degrading protein